MAANTRVRIVPTGDKPGAFNVYLNDIDVSRVINGIDLSYRVKNRRVWNVSLHIPAAYVEMPENIAAHVENNGLQPALNEVKAAIDGGH